MGFLALQFLFFQFAGCAVMHHTQIGEVDSDLVLNGRKFDIKVSNVGISFQEAAEISKIFANKEEKKKIQRFQDIVSLFQMGPTTGNPVLSDKYADVIVKRLKKECPSGKFSGLTLVRETAVYPVISGEIVKITGFCQ